MSRKSSPMRIDELTKRAIMMLAAEMQRESGESVSANDALMKLLEQVRPDLLEEAKKTFKEGK